MALKGNSRRSQIFCKLLLILGLVVGLGAFSRTASGRQNQHDQGQSNAGPQDGQSQQGPQGQPESAAPQDQRQPSTPPDAQPDPSMQGQPGAPPPPPDAQPQDVPPGPPQGAPQATPPQSQAPPNQAVPQALTLPAGTVVRVRADDWLSSDRNVTGDNFSASLDQPLVVDGWVVARRGQAQTGRVTIAKKGKIGEASQLGLDLPTLTLVDGQQLTLETELYQVSGGHTGTNGRDVATVGGATGLGAIIGGIAGGGTGAAIGAGLGATAGVIGVMSTKGRPTVIPPETVLVFRLKSPVTISTANSQAAFRPVSQSDYDSRPQQNRPRMMRPGPPPPPPYYGGPYPYPYAYYPYPYGWYPGPYGGYYGRW